MKRLLIFITMALLLIAGGTCKVDAQVTARTAVQKTLSIRATYYKYTGVAADTCGTEQDTLYFEVRTNKHGPTNVNARIEVTRTGSTETYDMDLEGKVFENDSWSKVVENATQTASKSMYQPETSMVDSTGFELVSAHAMPASGANFYRYWRVFIGNDGTCGAADKLTVNYIIFKVYPR